MLLHRTRAHALSSLLLPILATSALANQGEFAQLDPGADTIDAACAWLRPDDGEGTTLSMGNSAMLWSYASDSSWIGNNVALGAHGSQVCAALGTYPVRALLFSSFDSDLPTPIWESLSPQSGLRAHTASADGSDVHAVLYQELVGAGPWRQAVVQRYSAASASPVWTYVHPALIADHPHARVCLSEDGQVAVVGVYDYATGFTAAAVLGPDSDLPLAFHEVSTLGPFTEMVLSADGSVVVFASVAKLVAVDVASGATLLTTYLTFQPNFGALGLNADGSLLAYGSTGKVDVYERTDGPYQLAWTHPLPSDHFCRRLALSGDGSTLALAFHDPSDSANLHVQAIDLASGAPTMEYATAGVGSYQNLASEVAISNDGARFTVGTWGDGDDTSPQLFGFRRSSDVPSLIAELGGSVLDLDLSSDGRTVAVATKDGHANQLGGGGALSVWRTDRTDLAVVGVPRPGATIEVRHGVRLGSISTIYQASSLAPTPQSLPDLGAGPVYLGGDTSEWVVHPSTVPDEDNQASTWITLPDDPMLVGSTFFLQGLASSADPRWSSAFARVTILP